MLCEGFLDLDDYVLIETRLPALEIAERTGYASPASFTRAYRRQHGEGPRETRAGARR